MLFAFDFIFKKRRVIWGWKNEIGTKHCSKLLCIGILFVLEVTCIALMTVDAKAGTPIIATVTTVNNGMVSVFGIGFPVGVAVDSAGNLYASFADRVDELNVATGSFTDLTAYLGVYPQNCIPPGCCR